MNPSCETATEADIPELVELLSLLFSQEAEFTPNAARQSRALKLIIANPGLGTIYVAREAGRIIGTVCVLETVSTAEGGRAGLLEDMVVRPEARGRGVGKVLLDHAIEASRARGLLRLTLLTDSDNAVARGLYAQAGFLPSPMRPMRIKL